MVGRELTGTNIDVDVGVVEEIIGQLLNLSWPGSRPQEDLSVWPDLLDDLPDLGHETPCPASCQPRPAPSKSKPVSILLDLLGQLPGMKQCQKS